MSCWLSCWRSAWRACADISPRLTKVANFLANVADEPTHDEPAPIGSDPTPHLRSKQSMQRGTYTFKRPTGYRFGGKAHMASTWKEVLVGLCVQIANERPSEFRKVLQLRGRKREYFSTDYRGMTAPEQVPGTDVYVETNLSANGIAKRCRQVLDLCGYGTTDFESMGA